jgi:hypothetical protein
MKTETFNALLSRIKRDTSDTDLSLGMRAKWQTYELNVYCEDAGSITVECTEQDNEVQLDGSQLQRIENIFIAELDQIEINAKYENAEGFTDDYEITGTKQSDFY